jgi:23S rRNA (cytosine1962-C5)-methyltransferase
MDAEYSEDLHGMKDFRCKKRRSGASIGRLMSNQYPVLTVKPGLEVHLKNRHHAIYKSAVRGTPEAEAGAIVEVRAHDGSFLCYAMWNPAAFICGRVIGFEERDPLDQLKTQMERAIALRRSFFDREDTDCYRLINAEGDFLPGLIVDEYAETLVVQFTTLGMDTLRSWIVDTLTEICGNLRVFEKSTGQSRKKEGLENVEGWIRGEGDGVIDITERGLKYRIALLGSQKTGLFLDQREMRGLVRQLAQGRTVLDCCSYVGGFSVNALAGGALSADSVDYDAVALERAKENAALNNIAPEKLSTYPQDVFDFLRRKPQPHTYDFIILDPPAFAKRSTDLDQAKKAYTDLNRMAMEMLPAGGLLLTCSCSYQMDAQTFQTVAFHAARQAKRNVRILERHRQAVDHPVNLFHPEGDYLKSLVLWVE